MNYKDLSNTTPYCTTEHQFSVYCNHRTQFFVPMQGTKIPETCQYLRREFWAQIMLMTRSQKLYILLQLYNDQVGVRQMSAND